MLTDSEILDEKTQSLDDALQQLNANREDGEIGPVSNTVRDVMVDQQLMIAVECMNTLADLHTTISTEGVSSYDVQVLRSVQTKMESIQLLPTGKISLERYDGMFTPQRSGVNQTVSTEATIEGFWKVVKEWFFKLLDYILGLVKFFKELQSNAVVIRMRAQRINDQILGAKQQLTHLRNLAIGDRDRGYTSAYDAIQKEVLSDPKLTKCKLTLMGFGNAQLERDFDKQLKQVMAFSRIFSVVTSDLHKILDGGFYDRANHTFVGRVVEDSVKNIEEFGVESTDENYFFEAAELKDLDMYQPKYMLSRKLYYIEEWSKLLDRIVGDLRAVKRFNIDEDQPDTIERVRGAILDLTAGVKALERVVGTIVKLHSSYFKVSASYINYYSRCYEYTRDDMLSNLTDDIGRAAVAKIDKAWDKLMDNLGII